MMMMMICCWTEFVARISDTCLNDVSQGADVAATSVVWNCPGVPVDVSGCQHSDCWFLPLVQHFSRR